MAKNVIPGVGLWSAIRGLINLNFDQLFYKAETGWVDVEASLIEANGQGVADPTWEQLVDDGSGSTGIYGRGFVPAAERELMIFLHIPHGIVDDVIYPHIHWAPTSTDTGVVRWGMEWVFARGYGRGVFDQTQFTYIEQAGSGVIGQHQIAEVPDPGITVPELETDGLIACRVFRDGAHANDTYADTAIGLYVDAHIQLERLTTPNRNYPFDDVG